jgi:preprotein translocase subunit SecF
MSRRLRRLNRNVSSKNKVNHESNKKHHDVDVKNSSKNVDYNKKNSLKDFYDKKYKALMIIPFTLLIISMIFLGVTYVKTGSFIDLGVSIKGGVSATVTSTEYDYNSLQSFFSSKFPDSDLSIRQLGDTAVNIEITDAQEKDMRSAITQYYGVDSEYSLENTGSSLGDAFFKQMIFALIFAFIIMGIVVFIAFKNFVPSFAVILSAASDMIITLAIISFMDVKLSLAGIAAFLMLIGYSVDTDILLTTRVLKRKEGTVFEKILSALDTGTTMNLTTLVAITIGLVMSKSPVLSQIMLILFIGLIVDMINTWIQNVGILRLYVEKQETKTNKGVDAQ